MLIRAISAILGVLGIYLVWMFFSNMGLAALCSLVALIACMEFSLFLGKDEVTATRWLFSTICFGLYIVFAFYSDSFVTLLCFFTMIATYFVLFTKLSIEQRVHKISLWSIGALYCGAFTGLIAHGLLKFGLTYFIAVLIASFLTDTFAYLGGRQFGKTPLAPDISPKKTVEGSVIGLIGGAAGTFWYLYPQSQSLVLLLLVSIVSPLLSQVGDLFESIMKRYSGVKDSGKILPGHGGVLDRIDGVLFAGPAIYLWLTLTT